MELKESTYKLKLDKSRTKKYYTDENGTTGITELMVCRSNAGYYIGRMCDVGPFSKDSAYYSTSKECEEDLKMLKEFQIN